MFRKAIELDPGYSRAYALLAYMYWDLFDWGVTHDFGIDNALEETHRLLSIALENPTAAAYRLSARSRCGRAISMPRLRKSTKR